MCGVSLLSCREGEMGASHYAQRRTDVYYHWGKIVRDWSFMG